MGTLFAAAERPSSEVPRSRLPADHTPASGPAVAWIEIAAIGVRAPVIRLALNPDGTLEVPANARKTGWWSGGAFPGENGTAVIAGHVDSGAGPAVFFHLRELEPGDKIRVTDMEGRTARFAVERSEEHPKTDFPTRRVYAPTAGRALRLITCSGHFDEARGRYRSNLIVFARPL